MRRLGPLIMLLAVLAVACGVPVDEEPRAIAPVLPTTPPATPTPQPAATAAFGIYLADGPDRLQVTIRQLPEPVTITAVINELKEETTAEEAERGLISIIPPGSTFVDAANNPSRSDGRAELDFVADTSFDTLEGLQLVQALAQLVWTLTASADIDEVVIRVDGQDVSWLTTAEGDSSPGAALTRDDYPTFDPDFVEPTPASDPDDQPTEVEQTPTPSS